MTTPNDYADIFSNRRLAEAVRVLEAASTIAALGDIFPGEVREAVARRLRTLADRDSTPESARLYRDIARYVAGGDAP